MALKSDDLLKNALEYFPRWMDIRKRYFSSNGGRLLESSAETTEDIQKEIDEYVRTFFISNYNDKFDEIPDYIYRINTGSLSLDDDFCLKDPAMDITESIKEFYNTENIAYYEDGFVYIRKPYDTITYHIVDTDITSKTEKVSVWNVYDEFAAFINIKRYEDETNEELYNRILDTASRVINSTESGLKNAVIAGLVNILPDIKEEDITIERPTADNLVEYYDEFNLMIDKLAEVNRDVLKDKKWDIDLWSTDFKKIDYIPSKWDVILDEYQNGIGDNDDLKMVSIDGSSEYTDATFDFYKKDQQSIDSYLKQNITSGNITLDLIKYNSNIKPYTAKYNIFASELMDITDNNIEMVLKETTKEKQQQRYIHEIMKSSKNITVIEQNKLIEGKRYKVRFLPKDRISGMKIYKCYTEDSGVMKNLIKENSQFSIINGALENTYTKKVFSHPLDFESYANIISTSNGMEQENISEQSAMLADIKGCENQNIYIDYEIKPTDIEKEYVEMYNYTFDEENKCFCDSGSTDDSSRKIIVNIQCNHIEFRLKEGQGIYYLLVNGEKIDNALISAGDTYSSKEYSVPQNFMLEIDSNSDYKCIIDNLKCTMFNLFASTGQSNDLALVQQIEQQDSTVAEKTYRNIFKSTIPSSSNGQLNISYKTFKQYPIIIHRIYIGTPLDESNAYVTNEIVGGPDTRIYIDSNCKVELYMSDQAITSLSDDMICISDDDSIMNLYTATSDNAYIELDMSEYSVVENISTPAGTFEQVDDHAGIKYFINLKANESINYVYITGTRASIASSMQLNQLILNSYSAFNSDHDKVYVCKLFDGIIVETADGSYKNIKITIDKLNTRDNKNITMAEIRNLPKNVKSTFINYTTGNEHSGTEYKEHFDEIKFYPDNNSSKIYVCKNEYVTYQNEVTGVQIVNLFDNGFPDYTAMCYTIQSLEPNEYSVVFDDGSEVGNRMTINKKPIRITIVNSDAITNDLNFTKTAISINVNYQGRIPLEDYYTTENHETIELAKYVIKDNENFTIDYNSNIEEDLMKIDYVQVDSTLITKLRYSNINSLVFYVGDDIDKQTDLDNIVNLDTKLYSLDPIKGVIVWDKTMLGKKLCIIYYIKKPVSILFSSDYLYTRIKRSVKAYKHVFNYSQKLIQKDEEIKLADINSEDYDAVYIKCSNPTFSAEIKNGYAIFKKTMNDYKFAIKSGWYYIQNREYYLFAETDPKDTTMNNGIYFENCKKVYDKIMLHKYTNNFIKNSKMEANTMANIYHINDFTDLKGISYAESITACDSYNFWKTFAMNVSIGSGINSEGTIFTPCQGSEEYAYAYMDITKILKKNSDNIISFYASSGIKAYIGYSMESVDFASEDIKYVLPIVKKVAGTNNLYYTDINTENMDNAEFYIVIQGGGMIDDLIVSDKTDDIESLHIKNIDKYGIGIREEQPNEYSVKFILNDKNVTGYKVNGCELNKQNYIVNSGTVEWNLTLIKSISKRSEWINNCILNNISIVDIDDESCAAITSEDVGEITTRPIYVGEPELIKSVRFKINNVELSEMTGFSCKMYQNTQNSNSGMTECNLAYGPISNYNYSSNFNGKYAQLKITVPKNKVIDNIEIYVEYREDKNEKAVLLQRMNNNGEFISKVFDANYQLNYVLKGQDINIDEVDGQAKFYIRASREKSKLSVWTDWHEIKADKDFEIKFSNYRFFQIKVLLIGENSKARINYIKLGVEE